MAIFNSYVKLPEGNTQQAQEQMSMFQVKLPGISWDIPPWSIP